MQDKMDFEVPVLAGYLNVPMQSSFSLNRISKKKNCHRYCLLFNSSRHGIERLEICESKEDKNPKIVTLENCVKITQEPAPANLIQVIKKTESLTLNTLSEDDLKEWTNALQMVAFRNKNTSHTPQAAIEEDNDLYCSSFGDGLFIITLIPSDTSIRCNLESKSYMLHLTATELQLKCIEDLNEIRARWPYRFIRKYGYRDGKFTFEAGRKCCTGEGIFTLDHTNPQEIFRCMAAKMKSMKKLINCDNLNKDVNENHWSIAANMEAGSRSPLTPSNQQCMSIENNSNGGVSYREFTTSSDSLNSFFANSNPNSISTLPPIIKQIPNKPPRKMQPIFVSSTNSNKSLAHLTNLSFQSNSEKLCKYQNYDAVSITTSSDPNKTIGSTLVLKPNSPECVRKQSLQPHKENRLASGTERDYESIEDVTDAWKTLGIDKVKHTERNLANRSDDTYNEPSWQRTVDGCQRSLKDTFLPSKVSRVIDIDIGEGGGGGGACINDRSIDDTYDRLDFMSPNNKSSSGYNTIVSVISPTRKRCESPSLSDYEFIGNPEIQFSNKNEIASSGVSRTTNTTPCSSSLALNCNVVGSKYFESAIGQETFQDAKISPTHHNYSGINYTIKNCHRYCLLFNSSRHGIERLEICESKEDKNPKIVTLENCVKITQEPAPANLIQVIKKTESLTLNTLSEDDLKEWTNALQMVAFRNKNTSHTPQAAIEEDNDLYCSSFGDGLFIITLIPSDTSIRCNLESKSYMLHLTATELQLKCIEDLNEIRARWPYRFIRKYGYRDGKFTFEAGRKCCTGEGIFTLDHTNPQEIFRCMAAKMKSMKKLINCDNLNKDVNENHWSIAANMEAGSRSPLTPSNQQCMSIENNSNGGVSYREFTTSSDSLNSFFANSNPNSISTLPPIIKQIPNKPPRKMQPIFVSSTNSNKSLAHLTNLSFQSNSEKLCKYQNYDAVSITTSSDPNKTIGSTLVLKPNSPECVRKQSLQPHKENRLASGTERDYESIEDVTDAWKTLGIDKVKHTERNLANRSDDTYNEPSWQRTVDGCQRSLKDTFLPSKVSRVIDIDIGEGGGGGGACINDRSIDDTYDRLDFMSPNNKSSSGYNTIVSVISPTRKRCESPSLSDYEFIGNPEIQFSNKNEIASSGVSRTTNTTPCSSSLALNCNVVGSKYFESAIGQETFQDAKISPTHHNYSGINYTIVSKPKRV